MINKLMISAAAFLALAAPAAAFAQSDWYQHEQDHYEHGAFHDGVDAAHAAAHERGFDSQEEHEGYHRALRDTHEEFHDGHPGTWHDGYRLPREHRSYYGRSRYSRSYYGSPYGYSQYGYSRYGYSPYRSSRYRSYGYSTYRY